MHFEITAVHKKCCVREQDAKQQKSTDFGKKECPARAEVDALIGNCLASRIARDEREQRGSVCLRMLSVFDSTL